MTLLCLNSNPCHSELPGTPQLEEDKVYHSTESFWGYGADGSETLFYRLREFEQEYCWDGVRFVDVPDFSFADLKFDKDEFDLFGPCNYASSCIQDRDSRFLHWLIKKLRLRTYWS